MSRHRHRPPTPALPREGGGGSREASREHSSAVPLLCLLAVVGSLVLLAHSAVAADKFPAELVAFEEHAANPVFTAAGAGHWDARIRERGWILREGGTYRMWYTGYDGSRAGVKLLGYATSPDGLKWTRYDGNPIYRDRWVEDMMVVRSGDTLYMFAEGANDIAQLLTSADGIHWNWQGLLDIRKRNGQPIDRGSYGTPTAWHEGDVWYLFYERSDLGIWLAKSTDLKVWTNVQDEPVLVPGPEKYDSKQVALNQIVRHSGRYYAFYHGSALETRPSLWTTNVAVSDDLLHWEKYMGNPLFPVEANKSSGIVVHDGEKYRLYTMHDRVDVHFSKR